MKTVIVVFILFILAGSMSNCKKDTTETPEDFPQLKTTTYFNSEIFADSYLVIYGRWKLFAISGGFSGSGHESNFEYLEVKKFGIYGFIGNDSILEYGKISPAMQSSNDIRLKVEFEKDEKSNSFFADREKYVEFSGNDTLHLNSPCCDRYNYHFKRVN